MESRVLGSQHWDGEGFIDCTPHEHLHTQLHLLANCKSHSKSNRFVFSQPKLGTWKTSHHSTVRGNLLEQRARCPRCLWMPLKHEGSEETDW